jgi:hypothetical protein
MSGYLQNVEVDLIDRLLNGYDIALENILYKKYDITKDVENIKLARAAIERARNEEQEITQRVLGLLQAKPLKPREVVSSLKEHDEQEVRKAIRLLIERGEIRPSTDWRLRLCKNGKEDA